MAKKRISLSVEDRIYDKYIEECRKKGIILSKQVELFMENELKKLKNEDEKD